MSHPNEKKWRIRSVERLLSILCFIVLFVLYHQERSDGRRSSDRRRPSGIRTRQLETPSLSTKNLPLIFRRAKENHGGRTIHSFKILQLADIHHGEGPSTTWGPDQDRRSLRAVQTYLEIEKPDLVVLGGDQLTADFILENATDVHAELVGAMKQALPNVRWCTVMGNHDDHDYEVLGDDGSIVDLWDARTSRKELLEFDSALEGSRTAVSEGGLSAYAVRTFLEDGSRAADVYAFDTGGGSIRERLGREQVDWFLTASSLSEGEAVRPAVAFMHIPPTKADFAFVDGGGRYRGCSGTYKEGRVKALKADLGIIDVFNDRHVHVLGVGHNHGNSYCCPHGSDENDALHLCFGRHSGYGGYEKVERGARVYELKLAEAVTVPEEEEMVTKDRVFSWRSWVRLASGEIVDTYAPNGTYVYQSPLVGKSEQWPHQPSMTLETVPPSERWTSKPSLNARTEVPTVSPSVSPSDLPTVFPTDNRHTLSPFPSTGNNSLSASGSGNVDSKATMRMTYLSYCRQLLLVVFVSGALNDPM